MNKLGLNWYIYECSVKYNIIDYNSIDNSNIINIHKNLMKKYDIMFEIIFKKNFIVLLASIVNASTHTKCVSLSSQKFEIQPALINFYPNEYNQGFH